MFYCIWVYNFSRPKMRPVGSSATVTLDHFVTKWQVEWRGETSNGFLITLTTTHNKLLLLVLLTQIRKQKFRREFNHIFAIFYLF